MLSFKFSQVFQLLAKLGRWVAGELYTLGRQRIRPWSRELLFMRKLEGLRDEAEKFRLLTGCKRDREAQGIVKDFFICAMYGEREDLRCRTARLSEWIGRQFVDTGSLP